MRQALSQVAQAVEQQPEENQRPNDNHRPSLPKRPLALSRRPLPRPIRWGEGRGEGFAMFFLRLFHIHNSRRKAHNWQFKTQSPPADPCPLAPVFRFQLFLFQLFGLPSSCHFHLPSSIFAKPPLRPWTLDSKLPTLDLGGWTLDLRP